MNTLHRISIAALLAATPVAADQDVKAAAVSANDAAGIPASVVAKVDPSVVAIKHERAQGSGFVLTADGYIISNGHVVRGEDPEDPLLPAETITVQLFDDRMFRATVVGFWMDPDVSLLKINPDTPLVPAELGDSRAVRTGQRCFAVGNPKGLKRTYTGGLISNIARSDLGTEVPVLQTDAAINPGNSGGPLFDMEGRVIGINTYAYSQSNNLGFTIPTHVLMAVQERIAKHGRFVRGELGNLLVREMDDGLAATTGVKSGLMVHYVEAGCAAAKAGLRSGDVITSVDGKPVGARTRAEALTFEWEHITLSPPGRKLKMEVVHPGEPGTRTLELTVQEASPVPKTSFHSGELRPLIVDAIGLGVTDVVPTHRYGDNMRDDDGVYVRSVLKDSAAQKAGLKEGDLITTVAGRPFKNVAGFQTALTEALARREKAFEIEVVRGAARYPSAIKPDYPARDKRVLVITGKDAWPHLDVLKMEIIASGATVEVLPVEAPDAAKLKAATNDPPDLVLLLGLKPDAKLPEGVDALIKAVEKDEGALAAAGNAVPALARALKEVKDLKMTASTEGTAAIGELGAIFTGMDVESDGNLVTTSGRDRKVARKFIRALLGRLGGGEDEETAAKE